MADEGSLRYISWQECISREDELAGLKKAREWKPDSATGNLREVYKVIEAKTDVSTDYRVMQALSRRAAALDIANVMRIEDHQELSRMLLRELQRNPPPGYSPVTHDQLQRADKEAWHLASERVKSSGIRPDANGDLPAGRALREAVADASVRVLLLPLPAKSTGSASSGQPSSGHEHPPAKKRKQQHQQQQKPRSGPGLNPVQLPEGLRGMAVTSDGARICFAFNKQQCGLQSAKGCVKGKHVCTLCGGTHPFQVCPQKD
eukprot:6486416-Amphidinium_carterae.1